MHDNPIWNIFQQTRKLYKGFITDVPTDDHSIVGWSMFQQTRPLYVKPFLAPAPPPVVKWPSNIYVATTKMGVYFTENFDGTTNQPIWTRVNDGLATLDCAEFHLDPFDNENMQFVLINTNGILYRRRNKGVWENVLDNPKRQALCGIEFTDKLGGFCFDPTIQGRVWMITTSREFYGVPGCEIAFCSDDYGDTWDYCMIYCGSYAETGTIRAYGDYAWSSDNAGTGMYGYMLWTANRNHSWMWQTVDLTGRPRIEYNPLAPDFTYYATPDFGHNVGWFKNPAEQALLIADHSLTFTNAGQMWYSATNFNHQRIIHDTRIHVTYDNWTTYSDAGAIWPVIQLTGTIAPWAGDDEDQMLVETGGIHVISWLYGEDDLTPTGIGGSMANIFPYTNSIPRGSVSGGACTCGIQAVRQAGVIYS